MRFLFQLVFSKKTTLLALVLFFYYPMMTAQILDKSRLTWKVGISWSLANYLDNKSDENFNYNYYRDYEVPLSERYGSYRGTVNSIPPLSADIDYRVFKFLDLSAGLTWVCMWGNVYNSWNSDWLDSEEVISNSIYLIPSVKINYTKSDIYTIYSKIGYGLGFHFNRSDSDIVGWEMGNTHNDYLLDKGKNSISEQLEIVVLGARYKKVFYEVGLGSRYWGYGSRLGVEFKF